MIRPFYHFLSFATGLRALLRGPAALLRWMGRRTVMRHIP